MAWIYLAESADSHWPFHRGCDRSPTVRTIDSRRLCFCRGCGTVTFQFLLSGTTSPRSYVACCPEASISSTADSPARTSVARDVAQAWRESEADFFSRSCAWPTKSSPRCYSLRTSPRLGRAVRTWLARNWPAEGMILDGWLYPLRKSALPICETDGSLLLPTPTASDFGTGGNGIKKGKQKPVLSLVTMARHDLWPTPIANDAKSTRNQTARRSPGAKFKSGMTLTDFVRLWPTPNATDYKGPSSRSEGKERPRSHDDLPTRVGGQLNPTWVEWLMGYPLGWTVCTDWAMQWFRPRLAKHSAACSA
jgi:hypothetical protein